MFLSTMAGGEDLIDSVEDIEELELKLVLLLLGSEAKNEVDRFDGVSEFVAGSSEANCLADLRDSPAKVVGNMPSDE